MSPGMPIVLGVAGFSGSGKTTLARELTREFDGSHFPLDSYYRDLSHMDVAHRAMHNFDDPDMIDSSLAAEHLASLKLGHPIERPQYDFMTHTRVVGMTHPMEERRVVTVEGNFALHYPALRSLYDLCVYVETPEAICYERRFARDTRERGRSPESVAKQFAASVQPMAEIYVRPSAEYADLIVDGTGALDWAVEQVRAALIQRGLLPI
jgi:uridine kinase